MELHKACKACGGTGTIGDEWSSKICYSCGGVGWHNRGEVANGTKTLDERLTDTEDKIDDCLDKLNDIIEKLNEP